MKRFLGLTLLLSCLWAGAESNIPDMKFRRLDTRDGLSNSAINYLFQDSKGYIWIGTSYGLNRYDGYRFRTYYSDPNDTTTLRNNYVDCVWEDANGKLWFPNQFLPVAKEFRLYLQLSCAMINKVFDLFENREESVSINLSAIDINSEMVTGMIYDRLGTLKNPGHFIFEILESDAFEDLNLLSDFIAKLRTYGVMIAIDDFGAGYSNLLEIVKLKPDIIKIDGEIIKHLLHDEVNRNIIDVIIFLAKRFSVDLVAEYAESKELQEFLESKGIRYSQGYYFSKPLPYSQIDAYLESERRSIKEHQKPLS